VADWLDFVGLTQLLYTLSAKIAPQASTTIGGISVTN
jgi:hypothetical protein